MKNIEFDNEADAVYFRLLDSPIIESEEIEAGIVYDFDANNNLVGIEILNLKHKTPDQIRKVNFPFTLSEKQLLRDLFNVLAVA